jgi:two-component system nitrate/nitrite response regulator NarL
MGTDVYVSNLTLKKWFLPLISEISTSNEFIIHKNLESLYSALLNTKTKRIIILDIEDQASIEYFKSIYYSFDNAYIIAIGLNKPFKEVINFISLGFKGFIDLNFTSIELIQMLNKVMNGSKYISTLQQEYLLNILSDDSNYLLNNSTSTINGKVKHAVKSLTEKEKVVCELLIKGMTYKEIAGVIGVTSFTINQRVKGIYKKLDVRSRGELSFRYLS